MESLRRRVRVAGRREHLRGAADCRHVVELERPRALELGADEHVVERRERDVLHVYLCVARRADAAAECGRSGARARAGAGEGFAGGHSGRAHRADGDAVARADHQVHVARRPVLQIEEHKITSKFICRLNSVDGVLYKFSRKLTLLVFL